MLKLSKDTWEFLLFLIYSSGSYENSFLYCKIINSCFLVSYFRAHAHTSTYLFRSNKLISTFYFRGHKFKRQAFIKFPTSFNRAARRVTCSGRKIKNSKRFTKTATGTLSYKQETEGCQKLKYTDGVGPMRTVNNKTHFEQPQELWPKC